MQDFRFSQKILLRLITRSKFFIVQKIEFPKNIKEFSDLFQQVLGPFFSKNNNTSFLSWHIDAWMRNWLQSLRQCETHSQCVSLAPPREPLNLSLLHSIVFHIALKASIQIQLSRHYRSRVSICLIQSKHCALIDAVALGFYDFF